MKFLKPSLLSVFIALATFAGASFFLSWDKINSPETTGIGTRSFARVSVNDTVNNSATLHSSVLTTPVAAHQRVHIKYTLPVSAASGTPQFKFSVAVPSGSAIFNSSLVAYSGSGDSVVTVDVINTAGAQVAAIASTGTSYVTIEFDLTNGTTAGGVTLQWAQNTANASNSILLAGAFADIVKY